MFKGFYNLTSGALTHQRNLNVIANNMVNISTAGFKQERFTGTTFDEVMYSRVGNKDSQGPEIGEQSYILATSDIYTDFTQGTLEETGIPLDFAINGEGFFGVRDANGQTLYTRNGNFSLDDNGYLCLGDYGRVLSPQGNTIRLNTDKIHVGEQGIIYFDEGGTLGQVGVFTFANNAQLGRRDDGFFVGGGAQAAQNPVVLSGFQERSNTDMVKQMTEMMSFQRSLQSATQVMKMYDSLMTKATTDVGRL